MKNLHRSLNNEGDLTALCMHYVLLLRTIAFWGHALILWFLTHRMEQAYPFRAVVFILLTLGLITLLSWYWAKARKLVSDSFVFIQLLLDIVTLTTLLYFTGGAANPFVSLFMLPVTFAAAMLKPVFIWATAGSAIICYTLLMSFYQPMPIWEQHGQGFQIHVWGMWYGFLLSAGLVAYFVTRIGKTLKERDLMLAEAREHALETDKLVSLGTLAAGTAHELGTPLGTIAILSKDLESMHKDNPELQRKLGLLRSQVSRCKDILSRMATTTGQAQADSGKPVTLDSYLQHFLDGWLLTRPDIPVEITLKGTQPAPQIIADHTVTQSITNVLNNAADASSDQANQARIRIEACWDKDNLSIKIHDQGDGFPAEISDKLGVEPLISTQPPGKGLGLGLYLAKNSLDRLGGNISLENRSTQTDSGATSGVTAEITLPLCSLKTHD